MPIFSTIFSPPTDNPKDKPHFICKVPRHIHDDCTYSIYPIAYLNRLIEKIKKNHEKFLSIIMMPCRISVYEKENGKTYVSLLNMSAMVTGLPHSENEVIRDASQETIEIVKSVIGAF